MNNAQKQEQQQELSAAPQQHQDDSDSDDDEAVAKEQHDDQKTKQATHHNNHKDHAEPAAVKSSQDWFTSFRQIVFSHLAQVQPVVESEVPRHTRLALPQQQSRARPPRQLSRQDLYAARFQHYYGKYNFSTGPHAHTLQNLDQLEWFFDAILKNSNKRLTSSGGQDTIDPRYKYYFSQIQLAEHATTTHGTLYKFAYTLQFGLYSLLKDYQIDPKSVEHFIGTEQQNTLMQDNLAFLGHAQSAHHTMPQLSDLSPDLVHGPAPALSLAVCALKANQSSNIAVAQRCLDCAIQLDRLFLNCWNDINRKNVLQMSQTYVPILAICKPLTALIDEVRQSQNSAATELMLDNRPSIIHQAKVALEYSHKNKTAECDKCIHALEQHIRNLHQSIHANIESQKAQQLENYPKQEQATSTTSTVATGLAEGQQAHLTVLDKSTQASDIRQLVNFVVTPEIEKAMAAFGIETSKFKPVLLNNYQLQLAQEHVTIINKAFQLKVECDHKPVLAPIAPVVKGMCDNAMAFALVAEDFNQRVLLKQSEIFTKCANTFLKYAQAPVKGYVQGLEHVVTNYCPLLGRAFLDPVTAGKYVAAWTNECAHQVGSLLAGMLREAARADLLMHLVRTNQPAAQAILDQQLARQAAFDNAVKATIEHLGSLSGEQIVVSIFKGVTQYTADALIFHSIGSCIKNTASNARNIVNALRSSYAAEEAEILLMQTPEGFNLKVTNEFFSECQNTAKAKEGIVSAEAAAKEAALPSTTSGAMEKQAQKAGAKVEATTTKAETAACDANAPTKPPKKPIQGTHNQECPLDKRLWSEEQIEADAANKLKGNAIRERGQAFEDFLQKKLGGTGSFKARGANTGTREFDGAFGNIWYEAKSGAYWDKIGSSKVDFESFVSKMGERLKIAQENGAFLELHSSVPIPTMVKEWCMKKRIKFVEWLE